MECLDTHIAMQGFHAFMKNKYKKFLHQVLSYEWSLSGLLMNLSSHLEIINL